ncbi:hypothetical protein M885DRAFT_510414 [Pelagophyceae sp. CCMP2097]|nr:hypothetical protein M885DRAFT_510414 [Pelagophyceae sp. CCMP2097]|mmetsp:Transcript_1046/g.3845  ORF Transcript_1046/g.3845 Transcript_1046/m.3845 type:complete len:264 (-) Transcript_1046:8-799(-)
MTSYGTYEPIDENFHPSTPNEVKVLRRFSVLLVVTGFVAAMLLTISAAPPGFLGGSAEVLRSAELDEVPIEWNVADCALTALKECMGSDAPVLFGADVVAYFGTDGAGAGGHYVLGTEEFTAEHDGSLYWFSSEANKIAFETDPDAFVPQLGGFCAFAMTGNDDVGGNCPVSLYTVDPMAFAIVDGELYMFKGGGSKSLFTGIDVNGNIVTEGAEATNAANSKANWLALLGQLGATAPTGANTNKDICVKDVAASFVLDAAAA